MDNTASLVTAWATVAAVFIAAGAVIVEWRGRRFSIGLDTLMKLDDQWNSDKMRRARAAAGKGLPNKSFDELSEVLDYFEFLALLVKRKAIDKHLVWHTFFYWLHRYKTLGAGFIALSQEGDNCLWTDLLWLHKELLKVERKERGELGAPLVLSTEDTQGFLYQESNL